MANLIDTNLKTPLDKQEKICYNTNTSNEEQLRSGDSKGLTNEIKCDIIQVLQK